MKLLYIGDFLNKNSLWFLGLLIFLNAIILSGNTSLLLGEYRLVEILQSLFIMFGLILNFNYRKVLCFDFNIYSIYIKICFFIILFYEEASIVTKGLINHTQNINLQDELNIHNAIYLKKTYFDIPFLNEDIGLITILEIVFFIFISLGFLIRSSKSIGIFLLEKKFLYFGFIYLLNISISLILRKLFAIEQRIIHTEIIELFFYKVIFLDSCLKINNIRSKLDLNQQLL